MLLYKPLKCLIVWWANDKKWLLTANLEDSLEHVLIKTLECTD